MDMPGRLRRVAVYLLTFHAYRSWRPDNPRGYVKRGQGVQKPDAEVAKRYDQRAKHSPVRFGEAEQGAIIDAAIVFAGEQDYRLHYIYAGTTHVHALLSWRQFTEWNDVRVALKRRLGKALSETMDRPGPWFSRGGQDSRRRIEDRAHFDHLMQRYLPKREHRGWHWREGCEAAWRIA
jgi:hypothetical protein